jgi:hypothetical protein
MRHFFLSAALILTANFAAAETPAPSFYGVELGMDALEAEMALDTRGLNYYQRGSEMIDEPTFFEIGEDQVKVMASEIIEKVHYTHMEGEHRAPVFHRPSVDLYFARSSDHHIGVYGMSIGRTFEPGSLSMDDLQSWIDEKMAGREPTCTSNHSTRYFIKSDGTVLKDETLCKRYAVPLQLGGNPYIDAGLRDEGVETAVSISTASTQEKGIYAGSLHIRMSNITALYQIVDAKKLELQDRSSPLSDM